MKGGGRGLPGREGKKLKRLRRGYFIRVKGKSIRKSDREEREWNVLSRAANSNVI